MSGLALSKKGKC